MNERTINRALISVSDKTGVIELARELEKLEIEILSTGGTMKAIRDAGIHVISVSTFTGSPEVMEGRVKTLHPKVHGGILHRRDNEKDVEELLQIESKPIDLVIINLYPFEETVKKVGSTHEEIVENIDIGGPSMVRSAAKNHKDVTIVVRPEDYDELILELKNNNGSIGKEFRDKCCAHAFELTARYDRAIADYFLSTYLSLSDQLPAQVATVYSKQTDLRYGENPHQRASLYKDSGYTSPSLLNAEILAGKTLSYNNYGDLDACLDMLLEFSEPFACVLKHANPCGAATDSKLSEAYRLAYESDPLSAFGSIIGLNRKVDIETAELLHETHFVECIIAPSFSEDSLELLKKKKNRRLLALPQITAGRGNNDFTKKYIRGGLLMQSEDKEMIAVNDLKVVTDRKPTDAELNSLMFAWKVVKHTKSNAIVLAKANATVGIGMGQTSRVDSAFMAVKRAGDRTNGAVMASDAFFPMADGLEVATNAGITAVIQPGGSKGDEAVIEAANKANVAMVFTSMRHFKH